MSFTLSWAMQICNAL